MISPYSKQLSKLTDERLDDCLLMLILIDTIAMSDSRRSYAAERIIEHLIPFYLYDRAMDRYDQLTDDCASEQVVLAEWFTRAAQRDSDWKTTILRQLRCVVAVNRTIDARGLSDIAYLAAAIGAEREYAVLVSGPLRHAPCTGACIRRASEASASLSDRPVRADLAEHLLTPDCGLVGSDRPCPGFVVTSSQHNRPEQFSDSL